MKNLFLSLLLVGTVSLAQKPVEIRLSLRDGNTISGTTQMADVVLKTAYGSLNIPIQDVSTIEVGLGSDKAIRDKALSYLKVLHNNGSDELAKGAYTDLVKLGPKAIDAIMDFNNDPKYADDKEATGDYTIDNALAELRSAYNVEDGTPVDDIVLIGNQYTMGGSYDFEKLNVKTEYGNLSIPKDRIKSMEVSVMALASGNEVVLKLMASKHISGNQNGGWLKTGVMLKQGQKFSIVSSGEVVLASLSNQKYKPDGSYAEANGATYPATGTSDYASSYPAYGNVVYRIGDKSADNLRAGAKFNGTATASGMLYLSIYETVYNSANTGSYTVKVSLK